jgi:hypothetical protein
VGVSRLATHCDQLHGVLTIFLGRLLDSFTFVGGFHLAKMYLLGSDLADGPGDRL